MVNKSSEKIEIFDKDGNPLNIGDVIYSYIKKQADKHKKNIEDVYIGVYDFNQLWLEMYEEIDNGYDAVNLHSFGTPRKIKAK